MEQISENKKRAVSYLLGDLPEKERDEFEERLFLDADLSFFLDATENDLVDEYVRGELSAEQIKKFEENLLLADSRREKLQIASVLQEKVFNKKSAVVAAVPQVSVWERLSAIFRVPRLVWAGGLVTVILFLLIGGFWLSRQTENNQVVADFDKNQNLSIEPVRKPTVENFPNINAPQNIKQKLTNTNENPKPSPATVLPKNTKQPTVFGFTLLPPMRSGERPTLIVPPDAQTIRLRVQHNNTREFIKYRAEIRDSSGDLIWSREIAVGKKTLQKPIILDVRSGALGTGSYELTLSGITSDAQLEEVNFYNFAVRQK
jgi:hypothetical protein